jgi:hypothetical protein
MTILAIMVATIKQMLRNISGDCVRINIMVGEQGSSKASSYTDIKVHLIIYAFKYPDKPWVGTLQGGINNSVRIYARAEQANLTSLLSS